MLSTSPHLNFFPSSATALMAQRRKAHKWDVEYARYFATPPRGPSTPPPPGLRYISRGKLRHQGTWLPASTPAALCISQPSLPSAVPVLTVSIGGVAFEEHFVSILNFSWPQVTCVMQCPIRGSRVVFMSFCDKSKQIQKFAVCFPQLSDAESFLNCVKNAQSMDIIPSGSDCVKILQCLNILRLMDFNSGLMMLQAMRSRLQIAL